MNSCLTMTFDDSHGRLPELEDMMSAGMPLSEALAFWNEMMSQRSESARKSGGAGSIFRLRRILRQPIRRFNELIEFLVDTAKVEGNIFECVGLSQSCLNVDRGSTRTTW